MAKNFGTILSPDFYSDDYPEAVSLLPQVEGVDNTEIDFFELLEKEGLYVADTEGLQTFIEQFTYLPFLHKAEHQTADFGRGLGICECVEMDVWFQIRYGNLSVTIPTREEMEEKYRNKESDSEKWMASKRIDEIKFEMLTQSFCWIPFLESQMGGRGRMKQARYGDITRAKHHLSSLDSNYTSGENSPVASFVEMPCILFFEPNEN